MLLDPVRVDAGSVLRPVVGHEQDQRVIQLAGLAQVIYQPTDFGIQGSDHGRIHLHGAR
ncbi:hypothetical protein D3C81_1921850 [compost metagenome]